MMDFMGLGMLLGFLLVALVLGLAIYLGVRAGLGPGGQGEDRRVDRDDAQPQLDRRFAAGEIDEDEYRERSSALRSTKQAGPRR